jgi:hypothetical protein
MPGFWRTCRGSEHRTTILHVGVFMILVTLLDSVVHYKPSQIRKSLLNKINFICSHSNQRESGWRSRYSKGLRVGRPRDGNSNPEEKISSSPRRPDRFWCLSSFLSNGYRKASSLGCKAAGVCNWPLTLNYCRGQEYADLYIHSPLHLHGIVLN